MSVFDPLRSNIVNWSASYERHAKCSHIISDSCWKNGAEILGMLHKACSCISDHACLTAHTDLEEIGLKMQSAGARVYHPD